MVNPCSDYWVIYAKAHIFDNTYQGELVEILDNGNVKLVPPSESAGNDKNIETIFQAPDSQLHVITSKKRSKHMKLSALGGPEVDSENAEIRSESQIEEIEVERGMEPEVKHLHSRDGKDEQKPSWS